MNISIRSLFPHSLSISLFIFAVLTIGGEGLQHGQIGDAFGQMQQRLVVAHIQLVEADALAEL